MSVPKVFTKHKKGILSLLSSAPPPQLYTHRCPPSPNSKRDPWLFSEHKARPSGDVEIIRAFRWTRRASASTPNSKFFVVSSSHLTERIASISDCGDTNTRGSAVVAVTAPMKKSVTDLRRGSGARFSVEASHEDLEAKSGGKEGEAAALVKIPRFDRDAFDDRLEEKERKNQRLCLVALDGVGFARQVGEILRCVECLGVDGVVMLHNTGDPLCREALWAARGACLRVPIWRGASAADFGDFCYLHDVQLLVEHSSGTCLNDKVIKDMTRSKSGGFCCVFGCESKGVSSDVLRIPNGIKQSASLCTTCKKKIATVILQIQ